MADTHIEKMIQEISPYNVPSNLMECFDAYREEKYKEVIKGVPEPLLAWFLYLVNRYRGSEDRTEDLLEAFDPSMYTENHPAWEMPPGNVIELPTLTSDIAAMAEIGSELKEAARAEIRAFRDHADTWSDEELILLGEIAKAGLADQERVFQTREEVISYLALNSSAWMEDLWVSDATEWLEAPVRRIVFPDMVARRKEQMLRGERTSPLKERDFVCYSDDEVRKFACDLEQMFLCERARHLDVCRKCQRRLEAWTKIISNLDRLAHNKQGRPDA